MLNNRGFDTWAGDYDRSVQTANATNAYPFAGYETLMDAVYAAVTAKRAASVLDIGIGTGALVKRLYAAGHNITGIDFSAEMLRKAKAAMPRAMLIQHDFSDGLPAELAGAKFDFIVSTYALHHLTDERKAVFLRKLLGYLTDAGVILIGDVAFPHRAALEACKTTCGSAWDSDEHYLVFDETAQQLQDVCRPRFQMLSHCAGLMEIRPLHQ